MNFSEVEFKYRADNTKLTDFIAACKERKGLKSSIIASGFDYFYSHEKEESAFCRHRKGPDSNQLTFKRKTTDANNFVRTEHNLDFDGVSEKQVEAFCAEMGYLPAGALFKNCFIYKYDRYTLVYYVCYDDNMRELGRYIEIEMSESFPWASDEDAYSELKKLEAELKVSVGTTPQSRVKRSLYEMFIA